MFNNLAPCNVISSEDDGLSSAKLYISPDLNFDKDLSSIFAISST